MGEIHCFPVLLCMEWRRYSCVVWWTFWGKNETKDYTTITDFIRLPFTLLFLSCLSSLFCPLSDHHSIHPVNISSFLLLYDKTLTDSLACAPFFLVAGRNSPTFRHFFRLLSCRLPLFPSTKLYFTLRKFK